MAKLEQIAELPDGWNGPHSKAVGIPVQNQYVAFIARFDPVSLDFEPMPTPAGGIRMEWERTDFDCVAEFRPDGGIYLCALGESEDTDIEVYVPSSHGIDRLLEFYRDPRSMDV
ncbi:hypothetical protein [Gordonia malaquae]|uniref:hypothetical protein n=1 Tax=Gordonia malaquae TaxID=410332 RepID=UPI0030162747